MDNLFIKAAKSTPEILLDCHQNLLEFKGKSYPENTYEFYAPVTDWIKEYLNNLEDQEVIVNMYIMYFNSSSSKIFLNIFDYLNDAAEDGKNITVNWYYNNNNAKKNGEEFKEDLEFLVFNLLEEELQGE